MEVIFSGKLSFSLFSLDFERKTSGSVLKKWSKLIEEQLRKVVVTSSDLILDIVFLILIKNSKISPDNSQQGCQYCNLRVEMNNLRRNNFFSKKLSISIYFRILRTKSLNIQCKKKSGPSELHLTCPEAKLNEKLFLFDLVLLLHICSDWNGKLIESSAENSLVGSPNCLLRVQTNYSNELTFFRTFQFEIFFQTFSGK